MRPSLCLLLAAVAFVPAAPALAAGEPSGGTGVPAAGLDGGAPADPYHGVADEPAATIAAAPAAPPGTSTEKRPSHPGTATAHGAMSGPARASGPPVTLRPVAVSAAAPATSMPNTGFDLGAMTAIGLLLLGCGLLLMACAGPAPRRVVRP